MNPEKRHEIESLVKKLSELENDMSRDPHMVFEMEEISRKRQRYQKMLLLDEAAQLEKELKNRGICLD